MERADPDELEEKGPFVIVDEPESEQEPDTELEETAGPPVADAELEAVMRGLEEELARASADGAQKPRPPKLAPKLAHQTHAVEVIRRMRALRRADGIKGELTPQQERDFARTVAGQLWAARNAGDSTVRSISVERVRQLWRSRFESRAAATRSPIGKFRTALAVHHSARPVELLQYILGAEWSVLVGTYCLSNPTFVDALVAAANRGVQVMVVTDSAMAGAYLTPHLLDLLVAADVPVYLLNDNQLFHPKTALIDEYVYFNGSSNASCNGLGVPAERQPDAAPPGSAPVMLDPRNVEANAVDFLPRGQRFVEHYKEFFAWVSSAHVLTSAKLNELWTGPVFAASGEPDRRRQQRVSVRRRVPCSIAGCSRPLCVRGYRRRLCSLTTAHPTVVTLAENKGAPELQPMAACAGATTDHRATYASTVAARTWLLLDAGTAGSTLRACPVKSLVARIQPPRAADVYAVNTRPENGGPESASRQGCHRGHRDKRT